VKTQHLVNRQSLEPRIRNRNRTETSAEEKHWTKKAIPYTKALGRPFIRMRLKHQTELTFSQQSRYVFPNKRKRKLTPGWLPTQIACTGKLTKPHKS
jgi:hypothetical protein